MAQSLLHSRNNPENSTLFNMPRPNPFKSRSSKYQNLESESMDKQDVESEGLLSDTFPEKQLRQRPKTWIYLTCANSITFCISILLLGLSWTHSVEKKNACHRILSHWCKYFFVSKQLRQTARPDDFESQHRFSTTSMFLYILRR